MWQQIIGHDAALAQLRQMVAADALPHALLLCGIDGIGKRLIAHTMALTFFCATPTPDGPCGRCRECRQIQAHSHPDCWWVERQPATSGKGLRAEIGIDQIRALHAQIHFAALSERGKLAILTEADCMTTHAANCCLKLLEEPPPRTYLLLLAARPDDLLPTIRSRCQRVTLGPLPPALIQAHLQQTGMDPATAKQRTAISFGSLEQALAFPAELLADTVQDLHALLDAAPAATILDMAGRWTSDPAHYPLRLQVAALLWRDARTQQCHCATAESIPATTRLCSQLAQRPAPRLQRELALLLATLQQCGDDSSNKQLSCEALLFSVAA